MPSTPTIFLLTHPREMDRPSNTGRLVKEVMGDRAKVVIWRRKEPDEALLKHIANHSTALLYPSVETATMPGSADFESFITIDSTWQEARKIYNHSPYLQTLPKVTLSPQESSIFSLRRNQLENGLCTAECVKELLQSRHQSALASRLNDELIYFLATFSEH